MSASSATEDADAARAELAACEKEISTVKALLRSLGSSGGGGGDADDATNRLTVSWIKTEGLPESSQPKLKVQLSSPVEEAELANVADPLASSEEEKSKSEHTFRGVETGQAMLSIAAADLDIPLGSSTATDLAPLLKFDAMKAEEQIVKEIQVEIQPSSDASGEEKEATTAVCTVTLRLAFVPSGKDRREELYEVLNKSSQRKAAAVEKLRKAAVSASRSQTTVVSTKSGGASPAVKSGFLNKPRSQSKFTQLYNKYLGPQSLARQIVPVARNYVVFAVVVAWMHFKGQLVALPPPV